MLFHTNTKTGIDQYSAHPLTLAPDLRQVFEMTEAHRSEALQFLAIRPVHTVVMTSFINDNGIESSLNRGRFFGYRNTKGTLEGIALIGHTTLVEARTDEALKAFAFEARNSRTPVHLIMSSGQDAEEFWRWFGDGLHEPRLSCTELLFEVSFPYLVQPCEWDIRLATMDELEAVAQAQAAIAFMESGVDPMLTDRKGFLERTARRISQQRVFVVFENGTMVFKADIIAETSDVIYLEGIYVAPEYRGRGVGSNCLGGMTLELLKRAQNVCLLSNISFIEAHLSYLKAGYKNTDSCTTLFV
ncbi:MAG: GNAT family N-acetyltransferase [Acidobacteriota bacterium]